VTAEPPRAAVVGAVSGQIIEHDEGVQGAHDHQRRGGCRDVDVRVAEPDGHERQRQRHGDLARGRAGRQQRGHDAKHSASPGRTCASASAAPGSPYTAPTAAPDELHSSPRVARGRDEGAARLDICRKQFPAPTQPPASTRNTIPDQAAYWLILLGVYLLVGVLFLYSGKRKLFDDNGHAPPALKKQFAGTFIEKVPGVDTAWVIIVALMLVSLPRGEFLHSRTKSLLTLALALALVTFACLSFGQTSTGNNQGTASLYLYFASAAIILMLVSGLAPNDTLGATAHEPTTSRSSG
jgi:hypothetical protein